MNASSAKKETVDKKVGRSLLCEIWLLTIESEHVFVSVIFFTIFVNQ